jgi:hypothetical protein
MKKFALLLSLVFVAGVAFAQEPAAKPADKPAAAPATQPAAAPAAKPAAAPAAKPAAKPVMKAHVVKGQEVVSVDVEKNTITIKGEAGKENQTLTVDAKAVASLKTVKTGEKVDLTCQDNEKGEHLGIIKIVVEKAPVPAKAPEKK